MFKKIFSKRGLGGLERCIILTTFFIMMTSIFNSCSNKDAVKAQSTGTADIRTSDAGEEERVKRVPASIGSDGSDSGKIRPQNTYSNRDRYREPQDRSDRVDDSGNPKDRY